MALVGSSYFLLWELLMLFLGLVFQPSQCTIEVTVDRVEAYSALLLWKLDIPANTTITGFIVTARVGNIMMEDKTIEDGSATEYNLSDLGDRRTYNACVVTLVQLGGVAESGCVTFDTPTGVSTYMAIASAVFLVLCLVIFGVLDFVVSSKRKEKLTQVEKEILEQGWKTFQRNSKLKGKKRPAPNIPRPDSSASFQDAVLGPAPIDTAI